MRVSRIAGLLAALATAVLIAPAPAQAEPYPAEPPSSSVSTGEVADGGTVVFSGRGFLPGEEIVITVSYGGSDSNAAATETTGRFVPAAVTLQRRGDFNVSATSNGSFSIRVKLTRVGIATLTARGLTSGRTVTQVVEVLASSDGDGDEDGDNTAGGSNDNLPTTGSSGRVLYFSLYAGLGAILIGAGIMWLTRARRRSAE